MAFPKASLMVVRGTAFAHGKLEIGVWFRPAAQAADGFLRQAPLVARARRLRVMA